MQNLISRTATRQGIKALVLSAPYMPSQLLTMQQVAAKQSVGIGLYLSSDNSTLHTAFYRVEPAASADEQQGQHDQQDQPLELDVSDMEQALSGALGPIQPLPTARLQVAVTAEQSLRRQLRLWDPATWSSVLQQQLESRRSYSYYLAIRSLMGPPALQAAQKLVERKGLYWLELPADISNSSGSRSTSDSIAGGSGTGRRRRKDSTGSNPAVAVKACATHEPAELPGSGDKIVIVSRVDLTEAGVDTLAQVLQRDEASTDYRAGSSMQESAVSSTKQQTEATTDNQGLVAALFRKFQSK